MPFVFDIPSTNIRNSRAISILQENIVIFSFFRVVYLKPIFE